MTRRRSLTADKVKTIRRWWPLYQATPGLKEMSRLLGVDRRTIERCAKGETYRDVQP